MFSFKLPAAFDFRHYEDTLACIESSAGECYVMRDAVYYHIQNWNDLDEDCAIHTSPRTSYSSAETSTSRSTSTEAVTSGMTTGASDSTSEPPSTGSTDSMAPEVVGRSSVTTTFSETSSTGADVSTTHYSSNPTDRHVQTTPSTATDAKMTSVVTSSSSSASSHVTAGVRTPPPAPLPWDVQGTEALKNYFYKT